MVTITIDQGQLHMEVLGFHKVLSFKSSLRVPLATVMGVEPAAEQAKKWRWGIRVGTGLPGVIIAGTIYKHGRKAFWDVHRMKNAVAISLHHEEYDQLIVEVENPDETISHINAAVAKLHGG